jgi:hypothetical protein
VKRAEIESEMLEWIAEPEWRTDEARFERLALALFRFQVDHCEPYARYAMALDRTAAQVERSAQIPAVPTGAFKEFDLRCFEADATIRVFRTSGSSTERRGVLALDTLALYEASLLASLRRCFLTDLVGRAPMMRFLAPSAEEAADSSLSHMFESLRRAEGASGSAFDLRSGRLDLDALRRAIREARSESPPRPIVLAGTSFAFVHLLDATRSEGEAADGERDWRLPPGSRILETGGFKGRSREVPRDVLRTELARRFGLPETSVVNQYGMTELGSQFYDSTLLDPAGPRRKLVPPWTRVRLIDPATGEDVRAGEVGMILIQDLANTGSVAAIQTADLGRSVLDEQGEMIGFDVLGRAAGAEERGCSIAADLMLDPRITVGRTSDAAGEPGREQDGRR